MKRLVICRGIYCNQDKRADKNFQYLKPMLDAINAEDVKVKVEIATCLNMCGAGPNLAIYPDNIKCNHVDSDKLDEIIRDYLTE